MSNVFLSRAGIIGGRGRLRGKIKGGAKNAPAFFGSQLCGFFIAVAVAARAIGAVGSYLHLCK